MSPLTYTIVSYIAICISNMTIVNYRYNKIFDKLIKYLKNKGYNVSIEDKDKMISFFLDSDKYQDRMYKIYNHNYDIHNDLEDLKILTNIMSFTPALNLIYLLENIEFLADIKVFDYKCLSLIHDKKVIESLKEKEIIKSDVNVLGLRFKDNNKR